jgi:hypothetical protein
MPKEENKLTATPSSKNYPDDEWTNIPEDQLSQQEKETRDRIRGERGQAKQDELEGKEPTEPKEPANPAQLRNQQRPH